MLAFEDVRERFSQKFDLGKVTVRDIVLVVVALGLIGTWTNLVGYSGSFLRSTSQSKFAYQLGSLAMAVFFFALPRVAERLRGVALTAVPTAMAIATATYGLAYYQTLVNPESVVAICCFVLGACYIWFVLTLYSMIAVRCVMPLAIVCVTAAQVIEQILASALNFVFGELVQVGICVALPIVVAACLAAASNGATRETTHIALSRSTKIYQVILIAVVAVASVVMNRVSSIDTWGTARFDYDSGESLVSVVTACALLCLFAYACLYKPSGHPLNIRYQPGFLLIIAGYIFIYFSAPYIAFDCYPGSSVDLGLEFFGHVILWVVAVDAAQRLELHPNRVFGLVMLFGPFLNMVLPYGGGASVAIILAVTYLIVVVIAVLPYITDYLGQRASVGDVSATSLSDGDPAATGAELTATAHRRCVYLAQLNGLTDRELEVMELLVQGKTRSIVQETLFVSESTVKTHIKHIYAKFGVATITELMDLVFGMREDARDGM